MKVGILSMQRVINYGSFLQAYSLKSNIEALGHTVEFVDYHPGEVLVEAAKKKENSRIMNKLMIIKDELTYPRRLGKKRLDEYFRRFYALEGRYYKEFFSILGITSEKNYSPDIDVLVIGSDEVFNCIQSNPEVGYSKELFGANRKSSRLISYAGSFGNTTLEGLKKYKIDGEIGKLLDEFDNISVRDNNSGEIVKALTDTAYEYHLDPVFIYDYTKEMPKHVKIKDYIAVYSYACRISKTEAKAIIEFAKKVDKKIVCVSGPQNYLPNYMEAGPFEALAIMKNADYVVTDTFHGTVFSIKFNRKFAVYLRNGYESVYGNNKKLYDLLNRFGLENRVIENNDIEKVMQDTIDYTKVNEKIAAETLRSREYLKRAIEGDNING